MKRHIPFTSVSVDPEIQRMRDILANGGYVDDDGSLYNDREAAAMNQDSGAKAKAVPRTVVSLLRNDEKKIGIIYGDSEKHIVNSSRTTEVGEEYIEKENKAMKKMYVPFTSVSVDPEIQRMRDMLTSGENLVIDDDGTIGRAGDSGFEDDGNGTKAKTVPKAIVSVPEKGGSVRDLINEIRGEAGYSSEDEFGVTIEGDVEPQVQDTPKKTSVVPKGIVSTTNVSDLIKDMRGEDGYSDEDEDDNVEAYMDEPQAQDTPKKTSVVPKGIVSTTNVSDLIKDMRGEDGYSDEDEDNNVEAYMDEPQAQDTPKKTSVVPKGIVSTRSVSDIINEIRGGENFDTEEADDDVESYLNEPQANSNPKLVPNTVVSADHWYEKKPDLLTAEKAAMYDFQREKARFCILKDGRACWIISARPLVASLNKCANCTMQNCKKRCVAQNANAKGTKCRKYDLLLVYDSDHPQARYGSSVKAYLINPTIEQLQDIVNRTGGVSPKNIPHLLRDGKGELYLCSADTRDISTSLDSDGGITSAATSLRFALRWINIFELGLIDPETWGRFQRHGEI